MKLSLTQLLEGSDAEFQKHLKDVLDEKFAKALSEVAPKVYWRVSANGQRTKKRLCPPGHSRDGMSCKVASAGEKVGRRRAAIKRNRTMKASSNVKRLGIRRRVKAMKKRKQQGI